MTESRLPNSIILLGLLLVLVLHPLEAVAGGKIKKCQDILRDVGLRAGKRARGLAVFGLGSTAVLVGYHGGKPYLDRHRETVAAKDLTVRAASGQMGAEYVLTLVDLGQLSNVEGEKIVQEYSGPASASFRPIHDRIHQFVEQQLWTPEQAAIAESALKRVENKRWDKWTLTTQNVQHELTANPFFSRMLKELPERSRFTAQLLTEPIMMVDGKADAEWLMTFFDNSQHSGFYTENQRAALANLRKLYEWHDPNLTLPVLTKMVADSLSLDGEIKAKVDHASELRIVEQNTYRSDYPGATGPLRYSTLNGPPETLEGETDRWWVIKQDPAFAALREGHEKQLMSDIQVLNDASALIRGRTQIFDIYHGVKGAAPTRVMVCKMIYGDLNDPPNPLISSVRNLSGLPGVQNSIARARFAAVINSAKAPTPQAGDKILADEQDAEANILASVESLPSEAPCDPTYASVENKD